MTYPIDMSVKPEVSAHFDAATNTISYIVKDPNSDHCAIIDSVMDIDYAAGRITYDHADALIAEVQDRGLTLDWIIETHVQADHLRAAPYIQQKLGATNGVGDKLMDGDTYQIGTMQAFAMYTPGHTPACMVHVVGNAAFVGDTLFMPDGGSARADFPGGDAGVLFDSIQKVLSLPDDMRLLMCHDYGPNGRTIAWETTVAAQKADNIHVGGGKTRADFIKFRTERDASLAMPKLIIPSLQVNMRAGEVPKDPDGNPMLKVPINAI